MIGRKAIVGLSLLCALCFCAFGAASASAKGTTAGECTTAAPTKDFSDAHCDTPKAGGTTGHILFANGLANTVNVTAANDLTGTASPFFLEGKVAGIVVKVECTTVAATGTVTNTENAETKAMTIDFGNAETKFTGCTVLTQEGKCTVTVAATKSVQTDPMNLKKEGAEKTGPTEEKVKVVEEAAGSTDMGLKFAPVGAGNFTELTFAGEACPAAIKGAKPVKGFAYATGGRANSNLEGTTSSGATAIFSKASTLGGLTFAGNPASLEGTLTFRKSGGNPLIITTTEK